MSSPTCRVLGILLTALVAVFLGGCATPQHAEPIARTQAAKYQPRDGAREGYLIGSFGFEGEIARRYNSYGLAFVSREKLPHKGSAKEVQGFIGGVASFWLVEYPKDYELRNGQGWYYVIPLPAGTYDFKSFWMYQNGGSFGSTTWANAKPMQIPFTINPGEATYVGEVRVQHLFGENLFGVTLPVGGIFLGYDQAERDLPALRQQFPFLNNVKINETPISKDLEAYFRDAVGSDAVPN